MAEENPQGGDRPAPEAEAKAAPEAEVRAEEAEPHPEPPATVKPPSGELKSRPIPSAEISSDRIAEEALRPPSNDEQEAPADPTAAAVPVEGDEEAPAEGEEIGHRKQDTGVVVISRYRRVEADPNAYIINEDASNVRLYVIPGLAVDEEQRKNYPEQVIFLDGAHRGAPFLDNKLRQYSFDHHEGCVRAFTLATCEQSAVMLLKGLPISEGRWQIYVNQPDLDAVLAAWVLMNARELMADDGALLRNVMPLLRVEGIIDSYGLEMAVLSGLSEEDYDVRKKQLDRLMQPEREHRANGTWDQVDLVEHALERLLAVDTLLAEEGYISDQAQVEVIGEREIQGGRHLVLVRSTSGIYAVETRLRKRYGKELGVIILDAGGGRFTLKQADQFLHRDLVALYQTLNGHDPRATAQSENGANLWGGSQEIGGSPRASGSGLTGEEILDLTYSVYREKGWLGKIFGREKKKTKT